MAVYTPILPAELAVFLAEYDIGELVSFAGIPQGVENSNYFVTTTRGKFVLTLYEKRVRPADLPFFLGLMAYLSSQSIPCPEPVLAWGNTLLSTIAGRPATLARHLPGVSLEDWNAAHCFSVGKALAGLHVAAGGYTGHRANALGLMDWKALAAKTGDRADEIAPQLARQIKEEIEYLSTAWPHGLPQGIIHADFFPDNVLFEEGEVSGIVDFYFACDDALAYDLAIALNCWCFAGSGFDRARGKSLLDGYRSVRSLRADELQALPVLARGAALRFLLTRLYDWLNPAPGALVKPHDPLAYRDRLLFHRSVTDASFYE
jgi:homoserine kinase type II